MLAGLTARDMEFWQAWYDAEPRGDDRADVHAALQLYVSANANRGKDSEPFSVSNAMQVIRDQWTPLTDDEAGRRLREKKMLQKKRVKRGLAAARAAFVDQPEEKGKRRGRKQHRYAGSEGDA